MRTWSSAEVFELAVDCLEVAAEAVPPSHPTVAVRDRLRDVDEVTVKRVAGALACFGLNRQPGEDAGRWVGRLRLERLGVDG